MTQTTTNSEPRERKRESQAINRAIVSHSGQLARSSVQNTCMRKYRIGTIRVCRHPFSLRQENREFEGSLTSKKLLRNSLQFIFLLFTALTSLSCFYLIIFRNRSKVLADEGEVNKRRVQRKPEQQRI